MIKIETGGPAFPRDHAHDGHNGLSLRDYFAAKALQGLACSDTTLWPSGADEADDPPDALFMARTAYMIADAMLAARASGTPAFDPVFMRRVDGIGDGDLCLTVRLQNCLKAAGIYLVGDLVQRSERDLLVIQGLTSKSAHEIKEALAGLGLTLGMKLDNWPKGRRVGQG